jgi:hypothetical protein
MRNGRKEKTTMGIVDAQSVKNTDTAKEKGYDGGKKISGIKRHIAVDTNGIATCNRSDHGERDRPRRRNPSCNTIEKEFIKSQKPPC